MPFIIHFPSPTDDLMTQDTHLHASQSQTAVKDDSGDWSVELKCGQFIFGQSTPPHDLQWKVTLTRLQYYSIITSLFQLSIVSISCEIASKCQIQF